MDLNNIVDKLKDVLSESSINKKVFDKHVAEALNIPQGTFASMKKEILFLMKRYWNFVL